MNGFWQLALAQLWQVTAVILVVAMLVRFFARQRPHLAHALWLVVLLKCVTPPMLSSPSGIFCWLQAPAAIDAADEGSAADPFAQGESSSSVQTDLQSPAEASEAEPDLLMSQSVWQTPIEVDPHTKPAPWPAQITSDESKPPVSNPSTATEAKVAAPLAVPSSEPVTHDQEAGLFGLFACWLAGTAMLATVAALRWCLFLNSLRCKGWCRDESLEVLILKLSRKLGVRRRVRLIVTFGRIGPAVIGIFRPTVILPSIIVEGKTPKELEPILAHELMHFRRGDLWVGMLQVLAQALWWFHPLVWLVNRLVTRDAEQCCDEAVIARLGCDPLQYARSLVDVLELKQSLKPVPVVPGVRPVEVTSKRLERIMTLGQGSLKRSPWWCWAVMLAATMMLLPGAAFVASAKEKNKNGRSRSRKTSNRNDRGKTDTKAKDKLITRKYPVGDVFKILQSQFALNEDQIRELLGKDTMRVAGGNWSKSNGTDVDFDEQGNVTITDTTVIPGPGTPQLWYKGKTLVVRHTREGHQRIARHLEIERKYGYDEIEIETRLVTVDPKHLNALKIDWAMLDLDMTKREVDALQQSNVWQPLDRPFPEEGAKPQSLVRTIVDKNTPVTQATVDNAQVDGILRDLESDSKNNVLVMPKITCFNGRSVTVQDAVQRPFVVSLRRVEGNGKHAYQPRIRVVNEGITMRLRPVLLPDDKVWLDLELTSSEILGVETAQVQTGEQEPRCVQVPEVLTRLINSTLALPPGKSLIIGGLSEKGRVYTPRSILVIVKASKKASFDQAGSKVVPKDLVRRLEELEWPFGVPPSASIEESKDQYRITASPWRTTHRGDNGQEATIFSADKGVLVVGKEDIGEVTLELLGNATWKVAEVRAFAERGIWSNTAKQRCALTGKVRFTDRKRGIQLAADHASFDSNRNRIMLHGNAQVQRTANGKTDYMTADQIEWQVDMNAFNADGTVSLRTTDEQNKTEFARSAGQVDAASSPGGKGETRTGRLMFGVGVNSDAGVSSSIVIDENVQPASAAKRIESVPAASLQQLIERFNELLDKQKYAEAEAIAQQAKKLTPDTPAVQNMLWKVEFVRRIRDESKSSKSLPPPYPLEDDVQYFPAGPEFKLGKEATKDRWQGYARTTIPRPIVQKCQHDLIPTDAEVLQALEKQQSINKGGLAMLLEKHAENFRVVKEKIADYVDTPRSTRSAGLVQAHHTHYKCTVYFTETKKVGWPIPHKSSDDIVEVVYLDVVHNHRLEDLPHPDTWGKPENSDSSEEARIKKMLKQRIDVKYNETPLDEFANDVGRRAGVNVYLDHRGLAAEGITKDEPVTLKIEQPIRVSSALNLVLSPLHLKFVTEDEVVKITSEQTGHNVFSKVYNVADLVVPISKVVHLTNDKKQLQPKEVKPDFGSLLDTIITTIEPNSWDKAGGPGAIQSFDANLSVVVSQSEEVHQQIADLLEQLRRTLGVQVTCELQTVSMDQASYEAIWDEPLKGNADILSPTEAFFLLQVFNDKEKINVSSGPKIGLFPGQHLITSVDYHPNRKSTFQEQLHLVPTVSADHRSVTLECAALADAERFAKERSSNNLADGHTLMIDVTDQLSPAKEDNPADAKQSKSRTFILITPHVIVTEEEETTE